MGVLLCMLGDFYPGLLCYDYATTPIPPHPDGNGFRRMGYILVMGEIEERKACGYLFWARSAK
ncbi:hypothetical protein [Pasteuria penetrans]|uniref:hypothetical protein n=1 Tax=Pasteuria penetrans TaxID=86005 RepID=UPI0011EC086B|nr:hypothetical protein [Pasteuria penetrans]